MRQCMAGVFAVMMCISVTSAQERILPVAQEMPTLASCADKQDYSERRKCSDEEITKVLTEHLRYPDEARAAGVDGSVIVRFVVDEKGKASEHVADHDPGYGLAEEAIRAIKKLGRWTPGRNHGTAVKVRMTVPVRFKLPAGEENVQTTPRAEPEVYVIADQMPRYRGCASESDSVASKCTFDAILTYFGEQLVYPETAREEKIAGTVVVKFVVNTEGAVTDTRVVSGIGGGCDEESLRLVQAMPSWIPGRHNGKTVPVELTLPVRFVLPE